MKRNVRENQRQHTDRVGQSLRSNYERLHLWSHCSRVLMTCSCLNQWYLYGVPLRLFHFLHVSVRVQLATLKKHVISKEARDFKGQVEEEEDGNNGGHDEDKHDGEYEELEEKSGNLEREKPDVPLLKGWLAVAWPSSAAPGRVKFSHRLCFEGTQSKHFRLFLIQLQALQQPLLLQAQHLAMLQQGRGRRDPNEKTPMRRSPTLAKLMPAYQRMSDVPNLPNRVKEPQKTSKLQSNCQPSVQKSENLQESPRTSVQKRSTSMTVLIQSSIRRIQ